MDLKLPGRAAPVIVEECVSSTNTVLKELAMKGAAEGSVLIALQQSGGRGRQDRSFVSPMGGLYLSMLLTPHCDPQQSLSLTPCTAVAVHRAIDKLCHVQADIKWPNDLLVNGRKVCGILCESVFFQGQQKLIIGVGLNVSTPPEAFGAELSHTAGSILSLTGAAPSIEELAKNLILELDHMYKVWQADCRCYVDEYRKHCINCEKPVLLIRGDEKKEAYALGIDEDYALLVRYDNGQTESIKTGEVSLRNKDK